jgi:hypothetical protein
MAEKKVIEIDIESNLGSLKSQLREAQAEVVSLSDKFGATSREAAEAAKKAAELKDRIGDAKALTDAFNPDAKFNALSSSIGGVLNGFQAYEGALGLIGVQSEDVQKTLLKVQSAMALSQGLQGLGEAKDSFVQLSAVVSDFGKKALDSFRAMSTASKAFAITGIGLLLTGLTLVVTYWEDISKAIGFTTDEQEKYAQKQKRINEQSKEARETIAKESGSFATLISRLKATNEGTKEREDLIKKINTQYGTTLKNIKDETKFQEQLNTELASYLEYQKAKYELQKNEEKIIKNLDVQSKLESDISKAKKQQISLEKERQDLIKKQSSSSTATSETKIFSDYDKITKKIAEVDSKIQENKKTIQDSNKELSNAQKRFEDYGRSANEASSKVDELTNSGSKYVENNNEVKTSTIETNKELANTLESLTEKNKQYGLSEQELLKLNKLKTDALIEEQFLKSTDKDKEKQRTDALLANEIDYGNQLNALRKKEVSDLENLKTTSAKDGIAQLVATKTTELQIEKETADKKVVIEKESTEKQIALQNSLRQSRLQMTADAFSAIGDLVGSFNTKNDKDARKQFQIQKAFNLGAAITNTAMAVTGALTAGGNPIKLATGAQFVEAGIAATVGLANVAKIASTKFGGEGSSGGGGGGDVPTATFNPSFNVVGNSGINQLAGIQQQPVKAYITTGEVSTALSLERNTLQKTTF